MRSMCINTSKTLQFYAFLLLPYVVRTEGNVSSRVCDSVHGMSPSHDAL